MENKLYYVSQETSNIIYKFFNGETDEIDKDKIKEIYDDPKNYDKITDDILKELIFKLLH